MDRYKGSQSKKSISAYLNFLELLKENGHELKSEYIKSNIKVLIDFKCGHEPHWLIPNSYKAMNTRCPICNLRDKKQAEKELISLIDANEHTLMSEYINSKTKVLIDFNCGHEPHWIIPNSYKNGRGCPSCNASKGEERIAKYLDENGIVYIRQYKFDNLALLKSLRFDFYIPHKDICIEYDGQQHFEPVDFANRGTIFADEEFEKVKERDALKNKYCTENGINLIRIPYWEYDNIETILKKEII